MEIAALVSGGVDSSVIVPLLKEQGIDPHIFYIKIGLEGKEDLMDCPAEEDIEITTFIAKKYGCKFDIIDLQKEYYQGVASLAPEVCRLPICVFKLLSKVIALICPPTSSVQVFPPHLY